MGFSAQRVGWQERASAKLLTRGKGNIEEQAGLVVDVEVESVPDKQEVEQINLGK